MAPATKQCSVEGSRPLGPRRSRALTAGPAAAGLRGVPWRGHAAAPAPMGGAYLVSAAVLARAACGLPGAPTPPASAADVCRLGCT
jgi:hypothetical protein